MTDTVIFAMFEQYDAKLASLAECLKLAEDRAQFWREKFDTRLDSLQQLVIGDSKDDSWKHSMLHRLGKLDGHEGKDYPENRRVNALTGHRHGMTQAVAGTSGFVDTAFPIPEPTRVSSEIHTEEQKVAP